MGTIDMIYEDITILRSKRKTIAIEIRRQGIIVRAPLRMKDSQIKHFLQQKENWIDEHWAKMNEMKAELDRLLPYTREQIVELTDKASRIIPERVKHYAPIVGVDYGRITIRSQHTRWGSCSGKGNLNFNCLLILLPADVMDSVVVHELCHRKHMNHSAQFYDEVNRVFPQYAKCSKWLKENGRFYLERLPRGE